MGCPGKIADSSREDGANTGLMGSPVKPGMTDSRRQLAATLGRIYPYKAAKQQAPGVAATDVKEIPGQAGNDGQQAAVGCNVRAHLPV